MAEPPVSVGLWRERQQHDRDLSRLQEWLLAGKAPPSEMRYTSSLCLSHVPRKWEWLNEQGGVLYRRVEEPDKNTRILIHQLISH